ncbi:cysteine desulfurase NifS [Pseudoclavibacter sp. AY1F1]|uniref:cysteine desulfurase family protein n=1 Tax=Pseudoclavibacter sp. AY1F1 TaxID=2080583 RepID=UPI000CE8DAB6|nr:cysteine desulfurase family protein [Pseudoclavibacter sp. AY1F1]PPF46137.1 cysteine desulfurase NifS [Pseudoclavibacter sp. AY1F1]
MAVYLDHAATTPMVPEAREALLAGLELTGNPSSIHGHGQAAKRMLEGARERVASALGTDPIEVVLTSGGTEAINLGVKGLYWARRQQDPARTRILAPRGEHHATVDAVEWLANHEGAFVDWLPVDGAGLVDLVVAEQRMREHAAEIALVTVILANNEVGSMQPVRALTALAAEHGIPVHVDAVAAFGHVPVSLRDLGAAALSVSAHKIGGPVAMGALALARAHTVEALIHGGGQQRGVRSGTQDVPAALAFAAASDAALSRMQAEGTRLDLLAKRLAEGLTQISGAQLRGAPLDGTLNDGGVEVRARVPGNVHFTFDGCQGDSLLFLLDMAGFSVSTGSACQAGIAEPSHVLLGMGLPERSALSALRFTLGASTTEAEVDALLRVLPRIVEQARTAGFSDRTV